MAVTTFVATQASAVVMKRKNTDRGSLTFATLLSTFNALLKMKRGILLVHLASPGPLWQYLEHIQQGRSLSVSFVQAFLQQEQSAFLQVLPGALYAVSVRYFISFSFCGGEATVKQIQSSVLLPNMREPFLTKRVEHSRATTTLNLVKGAILSPSSLCIRGSK